MTLLKLSSATHLVFEFVLGFGGAVLVLEQSHQGLAVRNDMLTADNARFRGQAERDALTNTHNRHAFFQMLDAFTAGDSRIRGCAAMIDVDGLKQLNDGFGHAVGDDVLREFSRRVRKTVRGIDLACRMGGEAAMLTAQALDAEVFALFKRATAA